MMPEVKSSSQTLKSMLSSGMSFLRRGFNPSKCKTEAKLATARIKLLRNRREAQVEHVIREQNTLAANEIIDLFCELIVARLPIIAKQRQCPADLKEGISSLIYASPRCSEIPELNRIRHMFEKKYGEDFVSAATDLRPDSGVNQLLIEKLSVRKPSGEVKLKILKEVAKEYHVSWDPTECEQELLKPPEEPLEGPSCFVSAISLPMKKPNGNLQDTKEDLPDPRRSNDRDNFASEFKDPAAEPRRRNDRDNFASRFKDSAFAAKAAADSAEAISAAKAASYLANKNTDSFYQNQNKDHQDCSCNKSSRSERSQENSGVQIKSNFRDDDADSLHPDNLKILRAQSCLDRTVKFDDSDGFESDSDEEPEGQSPTQAYPRHPPNRPPPVLPFNYTEANMGCRVHPKLPDYEELTARFESLRSSRSFNM